MNRKERLLFAIGGINEKYVKEAGFRVNIKSIVKVAAALIVVVALSMYLFIPFAAPTGNLKAYKGSSYYPLIEEIDNYLLSFKQPKYKNNFESIMANLGGMFKNAGSSVAPDNDLSNIPNMAPGDNSSGAPEMEGNGSYVESTDNQVEGVIEADLFKMTEKYIFRLTPKSLKVYSIDKENSALISEFEIPTFAEDMTCKGQEMYLSEDGNTITVIKSLCRYDRNTKIEKVCIVSIDVSDVNNISVKGTLSVEGDLNTSRMVDGRLLLVTDYSFNRIEVDYNKPESFVPTVDCGGGDMPIELENIIYPDNIDSTNYTVVALIDTNNLSLLGANALLNFTSDVYVSKNNLYISREYVHTTENGNTTIGADMSDIAVFDYSGNTLEEKGIITVRGHAEDQYSFDERDGYLRVVTSTREFSNVTNGNNVAMLPSTQNVSLYVFDLQDNSLAYKVEDFAIEGEEATAVKFDGDMCYVCTAVVVSFTDPVYFIDLSDYENINSVDTGVIDGYSDHLISYPGGLLLGIGREDWEYSKVEIYKEQGDKVESIHEYKFNGTYSLNYKAYLINREEGLFGFAVDYYYEQIQGSDHRRYSNRYVLVKFDEQEMTVYTFEYEKLSADTVRAAYIDGYLYITTKSDLFVEKVD